MTTLDNTQKTERAFKVGIPSRTGIRSGIKIGNALETAFKITGVNRFADLYTQLTGKDCGCEARKDYLNNLV